MSDLIDIFIEIARGAVPYLVAGNKVHPVVAFVILPVLMFVITQVKKRLARVKTVDGYTMVLGSHLVLADKSYPNEEYTRVIWYLKEYINPKNCVFVNNYAGFLHGDRYGDQHTMETVSNYDIFKIDGDVKFAYEGESITIKSSTETLDKSRVTYLYLTARNDSIINAFIRAASKTYIEECEKRLNSRKKKVRGVYKIQEDIWAMKPLGVKKTFQNVFLPAPLREHLIADLDEFKNGKKEYEERGIPHKRGYLIYGPPGTGKTSTYYAMAEHIQTDIYILTLANVKDVKVYNKLIDSIQPNSLVVIDDIDRVEVTNKTESKPDDDKIKVKLCNEITLQNLLETFDGYNSLQGCVVVFTTNYPEKLDEALVRAGRVDIKILLDVPKTEVIREIFQYYYKRDVAVTIPRDRLELNKTSAAEIIGSIILPHRKNYDEAVRILSHKLG